MSAKVQYIRSIKSSYTEGVDQKQRAKDKSDIVALHLKKLVRPLLRGHQLDAKVQLYLKKVGTEEEQCQPVLQWQVPGAFV